MPVHTVSVIGTPPCGADDTPCHRAITRPARASSAAFFSWPGLPGTCGRVAGYTVGRSHQGAPVVPPLIERNGFHGRGGLDTRPLTVRKRFFDIPAQ